MIMAVFIATEMLGDAGSGFERTSSMRDIDEV